MKRYRSVAWLGAIALLAGLFAAGPAAASIDPGQSGAQGFHAQASGFTATTLSPSGSIINVKEDATFAQAGPARDLVIIVKLDEEPLSLYRGGIPGLAPTSPEVVGGKLNASSPASVAYLAYLAQRHAAFASQLQAAVPGARVLNDLTIVVGGVVAAVPPDAVKTVARISGVELVLPDQLQKVDTDASSQFIGATTAWSQLGGQESAGENVIVGVLDTGIWPEHPSLSDPDPSGKAYAPIASGVTSCDFGSATPGDVAFTCNNKLLGAYRFMDTYEAFGPALLPGEFLSARDDDGHGTHTSTTAAGNAGVHASIEGIDRGTISGIAPRARIIAYKVCGEGGCFQSDSAAAIQQAILDGVDVLNFSVSGGANPFSDVVELSFLAAYADGIFVSASAGNSGPTADTTDHRGPWVTTVAASTSNRHFLTTLHLTADGGDSLNLVGSSVTPAIGTPMAVVMPPEDNEACIAPFDEDEDENIFEGQIVVCQRLGGARILKSFDVAGEGAAGMILLNVDPDAQGLDEFTDNHYVPSIHLSSSEGEQVLDFVADHTGVQATFDSGVASPVQGDRITGFSSRGGPDQSIGVSKPDVTAPGIQILAGNSPLGATPISGPHGELFQAIAGTSMSSPHVAGAGAIVKALHPDWTPGQIKSALMLTATTNVTKQDGVTPATPFDTGSGRIDLTQPGTLSFTMNESAANYFTHPADLWNANYPSIYVPRLSGSLTVTRTVKNVTNQQIVLQTAASVNAPGDLILSVSPKTLVIPAGGSASFQVTMDGKNVPMDATRHGVITLTQGNVTRHMPVSIVRRAATLTLSKVCDPATILKKATTHCTITAANTSFTDAPVTIVDNVPSALTVVPASVTGATVAGNVVSFNGTLGAADPPDVFIAEDPGGSVAGGYLPLSLFGVDPIEGVGDETIDNFDVPPFVFAGQEWTTVGMVSDGYLVVGGGTGADVNFINQALPDGERPNNVLAPWWSDLNPAFGGAMRVAVLSDDGGNAWLIFEWDAVREYSTPATASFQVWIGLNDEEDITFVYGTLDGNGDGGFLTVGAENQFGNRGENYYVDGAGTLPAGPDDDFVGTELRVSSTPPVPGEAHVITFDAVGKNKGTVTNYAILTSPNIAGTAVASAVIAIQ